MNNKTQKRFLLSATKNAKISIANISRISGQSLFLWDWIKLSQSIENQEHLSI